MTSFEDWTMKSVSDWLSELTWRTSWSVVEMKGLKYLALWLACLPLPTYCSADPWMTSCRPLRVFGSSVLKSWSRSTGVVVRSALIVAPSLSLGALLGPRVSAM